MTIKINEVVTGYVTGLKPYGGFITLDNNLVGLLHISQISHDYVGNINDFLKINQKVTVKVIDIENNKIYLSLKALQKNRRKKEIIFPSEQLKIGFTSLTEKLKIWERELE